MDALDALSDASGGTMSAGGPLHDDDAPPVADMLDGLSDIEDAPAPQGRRRRAAPDQHRPALQPMQLSNALGHVRRFKWGSDRKHLDRMLKRHGKTVSKQASAQGRDRAAIAKVWSRSCIARGERIAAAPGAFKRRRDPGLNAPWQHARAWTLEGTASLVFSSIGASE